MVKVRKNHDRDITSLIGDIQMQAFEAQKKRLSSSIVPRRAQSNILILTPTKWWHVYSADYKNLWFMARKILHQ